MGSCYRWRAEMLSKNHKPRADKSPDSPVCKLCFRPSKWLRHTHKKKCFLVVFRAAIATPVSMKVRQQHSQLIIELNPVKIVKLLPQSNNVS